MSGSQDAREERRQREAALAAQPTNGLWTLSQLQNLMDYGGGINSTMRFANSDNPLDYQNAGISLGGAPGNEALSAVEFMQKNGLTPRQYQEQYGGLPFRWNADGTVEYDPSLQGQVREYTPASYDRNQKIGIGGILALTGAGLAYGGLGAGGLAGTEVAAGGAMDMGVGLGGELGAWGGITPLATTAAGTGAAGTAASALSSLLKQAGIDASPGMLDLIGKGLGLGLGVYGANQQANSTEDLYNRFFDLGAPYRASLASLEANPEGFYSSPMVQGALQQGSDALSRSLSAKVGNPILNPTAMQEMQNFTTRGLLDAYNNRFSQLSSAGQLGVSQAAPLGVQSSNAQSGVYNALGAGASSLFGNQRDYTGELLDLLKSRSSLGSTSLA